MNAKNNDDLTILGAGPSGPSKNLESFAAPPGVTRVTMTSEEVTSMCPVTGQPDFSTVEITYEPDGRCLESKSLKLYLWSFRDEGIFAESLADRIATDIRNATDARWCKVTVHQNVRGGIAISATASSPPGSAPPD